MKLHYDKLECVGRVEKRPQGWRGGRALRSRPEKYDRRGFEPWAGPWARIIPVPKMLSMWSEIVQYIQVIQSYRI